MVNKSVFLCPQGINPPITVVNHQVEDTFMKYKAYNLRNFRNIPELQNQSEDIINSIEVVGSVLPFKSNSYLVEELIQWDDVPNDPMFRLTFPQKNMLQREHFQLVKQALEQGIKGSDLLPIVNDIRRALNPHPANQKSHNVPTLNGHELGGIQHKYRETVLFFPQHGQTCHAFCSFCFRWPQFVKLDNQKFAENSADILVDYLRTKPGVTDLLITGGDPMTMSPKLLRKYIEPVLEANLSNLKSIRIGSKSLSYWPYKYINEESTEDVLDIFKTITDSGYNLAFMAHFNHPRELSTNALKQAVTNIQETGAVIRTQSPILRHINDDSQLWIDMWKKQIGLGMIPYYMFVVRDTGAQHYFGISLNRAFQLFTKAYRNVSGIARTVRGPSMSTDPGKILIDGITHIKGRKYFVLKFIQGRNSDWVNRPFFAKFDPTARWLDDLEPITESRFFFEQELKQFDRKNELHYLSMIDSPGQDIVQETNTE